MIRDSLKLRLGWVRGFPPMRGEAAHGWGTQVVVHSRFAIPGLFYSLFVIDAWVAFPCLKSETGGIHFRADPNGQRANPGFSAACGAAKERKAATICADTGSRFRLFINSWPTPATKATPSGWESTSMLHPSLRACRIHHGLHGRRGRASGGWGNGRYALPRAASGGCRG